MREALVKNQKQNRLNELTAGFLVLHWQQLTYN